MIELSSQEIKDLRDSMKYSRKALEVFRDKRTQLIKDYVGFNYSEDGSKDKMPVPYFEMAVTIYSQLLAATTPQVLVATKYPQFKSAASDLQLACNHLFEEIQLGRVLQRATLDALFSIGIIKVGLQVGGRIDDNGITHEVGRPFADVVSLDDWVHDATADCFDQIDYCGNSYFIPYDTLMQSSLYDEKQREGLKPSEQKLADKSNDASQITQSNRAPTPFRKKIKLWDIWLPREGLIVTVPDEDESRVLRTVEWDGPVNGPYHILGYGDVPDNLMPLSPMAMLKDLNELANRLFRKLGRQAERQKTITAVRAGAGEDGQRIMKADDGDILKVDDPNSVNEMRFGGADQGNMALSFKLEDIISQFGGNLYSLGGLSSQTDTVGQDQLLATQSSKRIEKMQEQTYVFARGVCHDLAWHLWEDPLIELPLTQRVSGIDMDIPTWFSPETRKGEFLDYNFTIAPCSMAKPSPQSRLQSIMAMLQAIMPMMPMAQQQGISLNIEGLIKLLANYSGIDELSDVINFMSGSPVDAPPIGEPPVKSSAPPVTHRVYTRINKGGASIQGKNQALIGSLLGQKLQNKEQAMMARNVG